LKECRVVVTRMTGNADFSDPPIDLAVVASHLDDLQKSEELAAPPSKRPASLPGCGRARSTCPAFARAVDIPDRPLRRP
jgi:hypothetical protein